MLIGFVMLLFLANSLILIVYSQAPQPGTTFLRVGNGKVLVMRLAYWCCEGESQRAYADYVLMRGKAFSMPVTLFLCGLSHLELIGGPILSIYH